MSESASRKSSRRAFLKRSAAAAAAAAGIGAGAYYWLGGRKGPPKSSGKKVIVIGIDGMDPRLTDLLMNTKDEKGRPLLPNLAKLREQGGFSALGTSIPPQSPVAWANFINGDGPGSHGIFDFIQRDPQESYDSRNFPINSIAGVVPEEGHWDVGEHRLHLDFWPFNHKPPVVRLQRQGVPFWDYLDAAGVPTTFYDLPSNYPPSPSHHGHHRCICGMGTPDILGEYPTYQHFAEDCPPEGIEEQGCRRERLTFDNETATVSIVGPQNSFLQSPEAVKIEIQVHRDQDADAAVIEVKGQKILLKAGQWSRWVKVQFEFGLPWFLPNEKAGAICRFYLQRVSPPFRLYVSPLNMDPAAPAQKISEPASFITDVSKRLGSFYTTGFQEEYLARKQNVFDDDEYFKQANMVLEERLALFDYAVNNYDDGLLFFYFSSSDLQSHMFWWDCELDEQANFCPSRLDPSLVKTNTARVKALYRRLDQVIGTLMDRFGSRATIFVMSDHGFANWGRQFNLNTWLRESGYLAQCSSIRAPDVDWSITKAYGLGINGLYLNLKGRERDGVVEPGREAEALLTELQEQLEKVRDVDANGDMTIPVIRKVYRASEIYSGSATALAPDLIVGYSRGYRASWETCQGDLVFSPPEEERQSFLSWNKEAWSADHCADALEVPGILFCSRPFQARTPSLIDVAPSILAEFGLATPTSMTGKSIFT
jgi:predicted AlkP superfamily phosphohydrolase/phosphomutase